MPAYPMTDVIAQREFDFEGPDGHGKVVASLGKPMLDVLKGDWYCPYVVEGPSRRRGSFGAGVDALQALLLALSGMRADLRLLRKAGKLTYWDGDELMIELVGSAA